MTTLRVQELREAKGLTMAELAKRADLYPRTIRNIERGTHSPTVKTVEKIADALEVPVHDLLAPKT